MLRYTLTAIWLLVLATLTTGVEPGIAQDAAPRIPLVTGLVLGSVLHSPLGEREDVLEIKSADTTGVHYAWHERTITSEGDTTTGFRKRFVRANDLAGAPRFDDIFGPDEVNRPGFTALTLSSAVFRQLRDAGSASFSMVITPLEARANTASSSPLSALLSPLRERYKGNLTRVSSAPEPFPLLVNGSRAAVPSLHLHGSFADGAKRAEWELWVLADSAHPLMLKSVLDDDVFQMVRADLPAELTARGGKLSAGNHLEDELKASCRIELPGVYFAFGTAAIDPVSDRALGELARALAGHPEWKFTVEGHTDSVGTQAANQSLSRRRAEAVRARLAERHGLDTKTWNAIGYGPNRPKESNATIEGRARNRRVELVRDCR
jgi:outer membrane protein OmpA-like peptidoglycan-associated protein